MSAQTILIGKTLVIDAEGNCLVLRRSSSHPHAPLKPDLPGGEVDDNESPGEAGSREIREETGLIVASADLRLLFSITTWEHEQSRIRFMFTARLPQTKPAVHIRWEHDQAIWVPFRDILKVLEHPEYTKGVRYIMEHNLLEV